MKLKYYFEDNKIQIIIKYTDNPQNIEFLAKSINFFMSNFEIIINICCNNL